jgi:hypothetical protein
MLEIRIRRFYRCDEGTVVLSRTYTVDDVAHPPKPVNLLQFAEKFDAELADMPGTNMRLMTEEEVAEYLAEEDAENPFP